jgi:glycosyltransferase involved in cell wall biosynthesis
MRVALIHNLPPGGALRTARAQLAHLDADLIEVCLSTATPARPDARVVPVARRAPRVRPWLRPALRHTDLLALMRAWRRAASTVDALGVDVILAQPCQFLQAPPALAWVSRPSVYFCHEPRRIDYEPALRTTRRAATRIPYAALHAAERAIDRHGVAHASSLVTNSRYSAGRIRSAYGRESTAVPLGVDGGFTPGSAPRAGHVLSVGTLIPSKGHDVVLRAAALAADRPDVVVVAPRPDSQEQTRLGALADELGVHLEVSVAVPDETLRDLYRGALATVQMGVSEPLGLASMEAQACGSPVVVAAEGGLPETIREGETGWAVARDPAAVADRLDALSQQPLRDRTREAAARWGATLTWKRSAEALHIILAQVASRS